MLSSLLHSFFIRTSKFCLRLVAINFFHFSGWNVLNSFLFPELNLAMPQRRMSDWVQEKHYLIFFILFLSGSAHRQPLGSVLQKSRSATVLKPIKKFDKKATAKDFNFSLKLHASSWTHSQVVFIDFEHRCSCILCRLAIKHIFRNYSGFKEL